MAQNLDFAKPESVGVDSKRLSRLDELFTRYIDSDSLAGAVTMVARRGKVIQHRSYGMLNTQSQQAMGDYSLFRLYSMTKPITTVAALMLYEQGRFQLTDPVEKYLPEFKNILVLSNSGRPEKQKQPFTVQMLMTHTAGFANGIIGDGIIDKQYKRANVFTQKSLQEMILTLGQIPLQSQPGAEWHYSVSIDVLARLVEVISGQAFDVFLQENIFTPLHMRDTFYQVPREKLDRFGTSHRIDAATKQLQIVDRADDSSAYVKPVNLYRGGSGLVSTAADYMRFCQMLLNGGELDGKRLLSRSTVNLMTRNHIDGVEIPDRQPDQRLLPQGNGFGLGFGVVEDPAKTGVIGSAGEYFWNGAAGTLFWVDPVEELIVIVMVQQYGLGYSLRDAVKAVVYSALVDNGS